MDDNVQKTIEMVLKQMRELEGEVTKKKKVVNDLRSLMGEPPMFPDTDSPAGNIFQIRPDQFYGRALATIVKEYLEMRRAGNLGAATITEIYDALKRGGYEFEVRDEDLAKRGLAISLSKNTAQFHRLPNATIGLPVWYPGSKEKRETGSEPPKRRLSTAKPATETENKKTEPTAG